MLNSCLSSLWGWSCKESSFYLFVFSSGEKLQYSVQGSVCAVMWSSHARTLRKYVTFHLQDAGRCKAAASLPSSLRGEDCLHLPSYEPVIWKTYYSILPHIDGGIWERKFQNEGWVMTLVRLNELHLSFLKKMCLVLCGRLFCMWCNLICVTKLQLCQRFYLHYLHQRRSWFIECPDYSHLRNYHIQYSMWWKFKGQCRSRRRSKSCPTHPPN